VQFVDRLSSVYIYIDKEPYQERARAVLGDTNVMPAMVETSANARTRSIGNTLGTHW
jgi:hypothetical protein